jgi:riboflavin kinase / FMN adenylyltransferase
MKIYRQLNEIERDPNTVLTIGTFDGIHLGHQEILKILFERSRFHKGRSFLITFHPHPRKVISKADGLKILSTPEEKALILEKMGLENLFIINFTKEFSQYSPIEFFKNYIISNIGLKEIIIGHDHKFGKGREGTSYTLKTLSKEFNFEISMVDEYKVNDVTISSTKLRHAIMDGDIKLANSFLGREYTFSGTVISGDKRGRLLGYPTANIKPDNNDKLLPGLGIYVAEVIVGNQKLAGLLSIGRRPTFYDNGEIVPEVYVYNFDKDIYNQRITINLLEKIRKEEKFSSPEELINQMNMDREEGIKIFNEINNSRNLSTFKN